MTQSPSRQLLADRVQDVVDLIETTLADIAIESADRQAAAPAMVEFISELQLRIMRIMHERLGAFIRQQHQPGD